MLRHLVVAHRAAELRNSFQSSARVVGVIHNSRVQEAVVLIDISIAPPPVQRVDLPLLVVPGAQAVVASSKCLDSVRPIRLGLKASHEPGRKTAPGLS